MRRSPANENGAVTLSNRVDFHEPPLRVRGVDSPCCSYCRCLVLANLSYIGFSSWFTIVEGYD